MRRNLSKVSLLSSFETSPKSSINQSAAQHQKQLRWRQLRIFTGSANPQLSEEIADTLHMKLSTMNIKTFADGEIGIRIADNVRGKDIFIIQPTCPTKHNSVNDNIMELILSITTFRRSSAQSITAVIPYYGYARQDRKMRSRVPISAADVARLLECAGVDRVVAVDLHCGQIQGFFGPRTPSDNLSGTVVALPYFLDLGLKPASTVIVSPDAGGVYRSKQFRQGLQALSGHSYGFAMIIKQREQANQISQMDLVGDVDGKDCIIVDDMIDTAGTLCKAGQTLKMKGARRIFAFATHGLFSGPAISRISASDFEKVVVCNTIPIQNKQQQCSKIVVVSVAQLIAKAIYCIHFNKSVSKLFDIDNCGGKLPHQTPVADDTYVSEVDDEY
jgi:ribose-phosphate pyrophosphokinase